MRFRSLDLIRYGHFTNLSLQFPSVGPDFHIVYGENEAGKSTTMAAIEDLLFGIPAQSPRNFLHDNAALRIGATLERDATPFAMRRRKGNKDTLLGADDLPLPAGDGMLGRLLGGVDRAFFGRMFCLDHERLRAGGRDIVQARDDVGATLFAAGAGISGLRAVLASMEEEAEGLWASRKASHRTYYQAEERLKQADAALRQHTVTAARWQELKSALDEARQACAAIEAEIEERTAERNKMTRVRRVSRAVHRLAEIETEIAALGAVPDLPPDAAAQLERAAGENTAAQARIETIEEQIAGLEAECAALVIDDVVLRHGPEIERLSKRQIELAPERASLPKRRAELALAEEALARAADELEWTGQTADLVGRIPARAKVAVVRTLLTSRGSCFAAVENAIAGLADAREALSEAQDRIETAGTAHDVTALAGVVKSVRASGDLDGRLQAAERDRREADDLCRRQLTMLDPAVAGEGDLQAMKVPPSAAVRAGRDAARDLEARIRSQQAAVRDLMRSGETNRKAYGRLVSDEKIVSAKDLEGLRRHRDTGWAIIRRRFLEQREVPESEQRAFAGGDALQAAYEAAVGQADAAADRRFQKAESTAASMVLARQIAELEDRLESQSDELNRLTEEQQALAAAWRDLWKGVMGTPRAPDDMLDWLEARAALLDQIAKRDGAARLVDSLRTEIADAKRQLLGLLQDSAISAAAEGLTLNAVLAAAEERVRASDAIAKRRAELETEVRKLSADVERKRKAAESAATEQADWESRWKAAVTDLNLSADTAVETVAAQIEAVETMREIAARILDLQQDRIGKIERDINAFAGEVEILVSTVAPTMAAANADDAAREMHARLHGAVQARAARQEKNETISGLRNKRKDCEDSGKEARCIIDQLRQAAGADTIDALRAAIRRSDRLREFRDEEARLRRTIEADGDGFGVEALAQECRNIDLDQAGAREQTLAQTLRELRERQIEAAQRRSDAARLFDAVGGDAGAAQAASNRQAALADMNEAATCYARIRSASIVLRWAVERFRREKQAPLLRRAGELFSILTGSSFERLTTRYDDKDVPHLAGVRPDGSTVGVSGLSDGTSDQLFLALRIAAIEEYLAHAGPTPFIADDLFINYDLDRAAAGFRVLRQLAEKTQVLFFTHHEHLVDVARAAFGGSVWASEIEGRARPIRNVA